MAAQGRGPSERAGRDYAPFLLRLLLGALFIAHLYWKFEVLPGGLSAWWANLLKNGYWPIVPPYALSAECVGVVGLLLGVWPRYAALYAMPLMGAAAQYWLVRKGFYFTAAGAELPTVWLLLLGLQAAIGDGPFVLVPSPDPRRLFGFATRSPAKAPASAA